MGRPLKISKYSTNSGVGSPGAAVGIDLGYPNWASLTDAVYPTTAFNTDQFLGVVGGFQEGQGSTTFPYLSCTVNILLNDGTSTGSGSGRILRQKGSHKYLVAKASDIQDEDIVAGNTYMIETVSGTNWAQFGASPNAAQGDIFTALISGSAAVVDNGVVWDVGQCVLTSDLTPAAGLMAISFSVGDSTAVAISKLTNKFLLDWTNFVNAAGTSIDSYASGGNNAGVVNYTGEGEYAANFFTDEGTVTKSGSELNASLQLAIVENFTS